MNPASFSMKTPVNMGATASGWVSSTASSAAIGAKRMTLKPR